MCLFYKFVSEFGSGNPFLFEITTWHQGKGCWLWSWLIRSTATSTASTGRRGWFIIVFCSAAVGGDRGDLILSCQGLITDSKSLQFRTFPVVRNHLRPRRLFCNWLEVYTPEFAIMRMIERTNNWEGFGHSWMCVAPALEKEHKEPLPTDIMFMFSVNARFRCSGIQNILAAFGMACNYI